jgi:hypothetical protein
MLVPHCRDDAEFGEGRRPPDQLDEPRVFVGLQAMRDRERFVDVRFGFAQGLAVFQSGETLGPLALRRHKLKSAGSTRRAQVPRHRRRKEGFDGRLSALAADQSFQSVRRLFLSLAPDNHASVSLHLSVYTLKCKDEKNLIAASADNRHISSSRH